MSINWPNQLARKSIIKCMQSSIAISAHWNSIESIWWKWFSSGFFNFIQMRFIVRVELFNQRIRNAMKRTPIFNPGKVANDCFAEFFFFFFWFRLFSAICQRWSQTNKINLAFVHFFLFLWQTSVSNTIYDLDKCQFERTGLVVVDWAIKLPSKNYN